MPETLEAITERAFSSDIEVRAIDDDSRRATFIVATENEVETMFGKQVLRMSGVDLVRFRANPVVLDTHNRFEIGSVVGKALSVKKEGRRLVAEIEFAETPLADLVWELVRTGFVRATSVGFVPDPESVVVLAEGESDGRGEARVEGPARIVKKWELTELSIVPVPADVDTLKRGFFEGDAGLIPGLVRAIVQLIEKEKEPTVMAEKKKEPIEATLETREGIGRAEILPPIQAPNEAETATRNLEAYAQSIRAIAPQGLGHVADQCILENVSLDDARKRMLEAHAAQTQSVGTPEPVEGESADTKPEEETRVGDLEDSEFTRALTG